MNEQGLQKLIGELRKKTDEPWFERMNRQTSW